jgi:hypothetical protein
MGKQRNARRFRAAIRAGKIVGMVKGLSLHSQRRAEAVVEDAKQRHRRWKREVRRAEKIHTEAAPVPVTKAPKPRTRAKTDPKTPKAPKRRSKPPGGG